MVRRFATPGGGGSNEDEEEEERRRRSPADGDSRIPDAEEQREEETALRAAGSNLEQQEDDPLEEIARRQREQQGRDPSTGGASTGPRDDDPSEGGGTDSDGVDDDQETNGADNPPGSDTDDPAGEADSNADETGADVDETGTDADTVDEDSVEIEEIIERNVDDGMRGASGEPIGRQQRAALDFEQRLIDEKAFLTDPGQVDIHLGQTAEGEAVFVPEITEEAATARTLDVTPADIDVTDDGIEAETAAGERGIRQFEEEQFAEEIGVTTADIDITPRGAIMPTTTAGERALRQFNEEQFAEDIGAGVGDIQLTAEGEVKPTTEAGERSLRQFNEEQIAEDIGVGAGDVQLTAGGVLRPTSEEGQDALVEAGFFERDTSLDALLQRDAQSAAIAGANVAATDFQRRQATGHIEEEFEEELGIDLEPGEDFRVFDTEEGFRGEITDEGRRKFAVEQSDLVQLTEGTPFEGVFRTGAGLQYDLRTRVDEEEFLDDVLGPVDDTAREFVSGDFSAVPEAFSGPVSRAFPGADSPLVQRPAHAVDETISTVGGAVDRATPDFDHPLVQDPIEAGRATSEEVEQLLDRDPSDIGTGLVAAGVAPLVTPEPVTTGVGAGAVAAGAAIAGGVALASQLEREDIEREITSRPEVATVSAIATAAASRDIEDDLFPAEFPTPGREDPQFVPEHEMPEDGEIFAPGADIEPPVQDLPELVPAAELGEGARFQPPELDTPDSSDPVFSEEFAVPGLETQQLLQRQRQRIDREIESTGATGGHDAPAVPADMIPEGPVTIGESPGELGEGGGLSIVFTEHPRSMPLERIETSEATIQLEPDLGRAVAAERARQDAEIESGRELDFDTVESAARQATGPEIHPIAADSMATGTGDATMASIEEHAIEPVDERFTPVEEQGPDVDIGIREDTEIAQTQSQVQDELQRFDEAAAEVVDPTATEIGFGVGNQFVEPYEFAPGPGFAHPAVNELVGAIDPSPDESLPKIEDEEWFTQDFEFDVTTGGEILAGTAEEAAGLGGDGVDLSEFDAAIERDGLR